MALMAAGDVTAVMNLLNEIEGFYSENFTIFAP
jgi:hypothetical protein